MNIDKRRRSECFKADCKYAEIKCLVFLGNDCIRLGGTKIPVHRVVDEKAYPVRPSLVKPRFSELSGWKMDHVLIKEG